MKTDESLSQVFGMEPMPESEVEVINKPALNITHSEKIEDDYDHARGNLRKLLLDGQAALQTALSVAQQSEHPRAIEVVGNLMKQLADINQQLLDIHQQKQKLDGPKETARREVTNNNVIFTGSTAELNKLIKNMAKGE
jgi:ABC-type proline/glycine betaine transport system substrate-binding protein